VVDEVVEGGVVAGGGAVCVRLGGDVGGGVGFRGGVDVLSRVRVVGVGVVVTVVEGVSLMVAGLAG
jgi:hypothetical protein